MRCRGIQLPDEPVRYDLLLLLHGRGERLGRLHLLRVKPLSLGARERRRVDPGHPLERRSVGQQEPLITPGQLL